MKFWTLKDEDGAYYIDEFKAYGSTEFTDADAVLARMEWSTMKQFYDDGFTRVKVMLVELEQ